MKIPLAIGDRVVAAFPHRDNVLVITETGDVFEIVVSRDEMNRTVRLVQRA